MTRDQVIDKIKKLLRMKRGGTPDEVATALRLARELAEKHGVDLGAVNPDDERHDRPINHHDALISARIQFECKYAGLVAVQFFHVEVFTRWEAFKYRLTFVGTDWDTQIALYVYYFLVGHFRREWKTRRGRCRNRQAFMWGMYQGVCSKLRERQPAKVQAPGIVIVDRQLQRRKDYVGKHFGTLTSETVQPDSNARVSENAGYIAGRETEIRSGVKAAKENVELPSPMKLLTG